MPLLAPVGATLNLNVQFLPVQSGSFDGTLTLVSNDSANPTQTLRITSIADSSPTARISVSPSSIVFSGVSVGQSASALLTVASQGTAPLVVSSAKFSTTEFSLGAVTLPATLVAGQQSFELRFTPSAAGVRTGILTLATNDPKNATLTVLLAGMGLALSTTAAGQPALRLQQPFLQTFNGRSDVSGNTWLEIYGSNFASKGRAWTGADFQGSQGPTSLDGWSVAVNGKPAVVYYISPGQINVNVPDDTVTGPVPVQVKGPGNVISNTMTVNRQTSTPALQTNPSWTVNGTSYVVAVHPDSTATQTVFVGPPGLIPGVAFKTVKPGGTFSVYAVGCGPANGVSAGVAAAGSNSLSLPHEILIGGVPVLLLYDGYAPGAIGLVQFNVVVPNLPPGNYPIELIVNGVSNGQGLMINIGQ
jgi:uncharacterized protein (TIGR03437 family)